MDHIELESNLLKWIEEQVAAKRAENKPAVVPVHYLLMRFAAATKEDNPEDLTQSTVLSLDTFNREMVYGALRRMQQQSKLRFVDERGEDIVAQKGGGFSAKLTEAGITDFVTLP